MLEVWTEVAEMPDRDTVIKIDFYVAKHLLRELNAAELKKKWEKHLKRQARKNAKQRKQAAVQ